MIKKILLSIWHFIEAVGEGRRMRVDKHVRELTKDRK
jgi:hypothetical protein